MSPDSPPVLVLASHGQLAVAALAAARQILGELEPAEAFSLQSGTKLDELDRHITGVVAPEGECRRAIVLVDLFGGSCSNVAAKILKRVPGAAERIRVIAGFNLAMIIEFAFTRNQGTLDELAARLLDAGKKACLDVNKKYAGIGK